MKTCQEINPQLQKSGYKSLGKKINFISVGDANTTANSINCQTIFTIQSSSVQSVPMEHLMAAETRVPFHSCPSGLHYAHSALRSLDKFIYLNKFISVNPRSASLLWFIWASQWRVIPHSSLGVYQGEHAV